MEQPPGSLDDLRPQDLSTSSVPSVIDLTRKGEECVVNTTSRDALRMVKSPVWYPNSGTSNPGLPLSETGSSDITLQSGDQIQPDNAFSHTTVTLSYVSRSHVFTTHDSLTRHSPLYGVPPISKLSLHPPCDSDKGLGETGCAFNQHCLEQVEGPVHLATETELFQSQVGPENNRGLRLTPAPRELNGGVISSDGNVAKHVQGEEGHIRSRENRNGLENGQGHGWSSGEDEERGGSEVLFVMSKKQDPVLDPDSVAAIDQCSRSREYISPLEDPVSPSATSQDDVEDVFILPQASSSPSGNNSYLETTEEVVWEALSTEGALQPGSGIRDSATRLDSSEENKQPVHTGKAVLQPLIDLTGDVCVSDVSENKPRTVIPHMNGNAKALQRTLTEKKLPVRSGRGTRLEAIVMNINSSRYKVSGCIRTSKKANAPKSAASDSKLASPKRKDTLSVGKRKSRAKASFSVKTIKQKAVIPMKRGQTNNINTDSCKDSTSDSEINHSKMSHSSTPPKSPQSAVHKNSKKEPEHLSHPDPSLDLHAKRSPPPSLPPKSPKKSPGKAKGKATGSKTSPTAKTKGVRTPKRRRKKLQQIKSSSMFSPREPEIKLRYVSYKEERRDPRLDRFSPFVRVECQQSSPSLCTVINYPEEVRTQHKKGQQQQAHPGGFVSAVVPSTSCLQLGRASMHSQHQRYLVCCLCGLSANAMDLGDLHGPYYPEGYQLSTKTPASMSGLKEEDFSDSDSSSCSIRGRGRKGAIPPAPRHPRPGARLNEKGLTGSHRWAADCTGSPAAKRARSDAGSADVEDWYSPPVVPLEPCEYWLHEDCGIWSAGVFLVKGKVYGLEEAVKVAQETTCSACREPGATLGCFFKCCPNKYHYRCALESECVLIEANFSMKCKKHKNKTFKAPPGKRWDDR
ncbi:retinoic acid-induced protein 1 [Micropterus salmoides]|uniref:retinoic acid-induced protein 1 n=1 Tax=Micropterus salmoides TaxID=27706 RepID=UPI0018EDB6A0|nr:retinoic acid-induced protein 1 [Micropterus salmoides]XP_038591523.1 retinoic acid-induced protein 1 [Micropterus salmoides]